LGVTGVIEKIDNHVDKYVSRYAFNKDSINDKLELDDDDDDDDDTKEYKWWSRHKYVEPTIVYDRFNKIDVSNKKIIFPKEISELFWNVFQTASGKEIMFYGELENTEDSPDIYTVSNINFPPQKNYGGYVETVDGEYEKWAFNEIILKGKKIPLHVHTHPDFSAFSSSIDETQIKQFILDNEGNPFVIQLIVSNPRKGSYFIRWFDLINNTWERPEVKFTFDTYDVEANYPGIFQFNAPRIYDNKTYDFKKSSGEIKRSRDWWHDMNEKNEEDEEDQSLDLSNQKDFDEYFSKKYRNLKNIKT
jgi:hypothetical protein